MANNTRRSVPNAHKQGVIQNSYSSLLEGLDPKVAATLSAKWGEDQRLFFEAVQKKNAGKEAHEWGKANCKHCYGRGYDSVRVDDGTKVTCRCAVKRYKQWLQDFREEYNKTRDEKDAAADTQTQTSTGGPEDLQEALTDSTALSE